MEKNITISLKQAIAIISFFLSTFTPAIYFFAQKRTESELSNVTLRQDFLNLRAHHERDMEAIKKEMHNISAGYNADLDRLLGVLNQIILRSENFKTEIRK
jgi:hypothetical protein